MNKETVPCGTPTLNKRGWQKGHTLSRKYFIDYDAQVRECALCGEVLPFSNFSLDFNSIGSGRVISQCKKCRSYQVANASREKKMNKAPHRYFQCSNDGCNHIWSNHYGEKCKRCGSVGEKGCE